MKREYIVIAATWIIMIYLLIKYIPKNKIRQAQVAFLITQVVTWIIGLLVVELRLIEYPVRIFSYANRSSFTFEFFIYPPNLCII